MRQVTFRKNKKGAAMIYAVMVLLLLSTVVVALTARSTGSYNDAVLTVADDQSYYYAKSIGLAIKEQFKDGYNIARVISALDAQEKVYDEKKKTNDPYDPKVTGTFNIASDEGEVVSGTVQIRYARDDNDDEIKTKVEVRAACIVNNSPAVVTAIYSCAEDDNGKKKDKIEKALSAYDVILTAETAPDFNFSQAADEQGKSSVNIYVYVGEDDSVQNDPFYLYYDMAGLLTTTGKSKLISRKVGTETAQYHVITGSLTSYGDMKLENTGVMGNNVHVDGNLEIGTLSFVQKNVYARGSVTVKTPATTNLHSYFAGSDANNFGVYDAGYVVAYHNEKMGITDDKLKTVQYHSAATIYAQGDVTLNARAYLTGGIYSHGSVTVIGKGVGTNWTDENNWDKNDRVGNTYVTGDIYSDGDVWIKNGAVVGGSIYALGTVTIENGAFVIGGVQSTSGNVIVKGSAVGGQVNAPNGQIYLSNKGYETVAINNLPAYDNGGKVTYGGIGLNQKATETDILNDKDDSNKKIFRHTCNSLFTDDTNALSIIRGNIHVTEATPSTGGNYTPLVSVWCQGKVYLKTSSARFTTVVYGGRSWFGTNDYGNPYTYILQLNQNADLADISNDNPWMNIYGAHIRYLNLGEYEKEQNKDPVYNVYDAYIYNGWIENVNARCLFVSDMQFTAGNIHLARFMHLYGSGNGSAYNNTSRYRNSAMTYTYATSGKTEIPAGTSINIACNKPTYNGRFTEEARCGFSVGIYTEVKNGALILVGSDDKESVDAYVMIGDESKPGTTRFYGGMCAYVSDFKITENAYLSTRKSEGSYTAATILAEIKPGSNPVYSNDAIRPALAANSFYVAPSGSSGGQYRWGSLIQVRGNAYIEGHVYDFQHFYPGTFTNKDTAKFKGTYVSTLDNIRLSGKSCFNSIELSNASAKVKLDSDLSPTGYFRVNGKLDINGKSLTVNGDCYIGSLAAEDIKNADINGNLTIGSINNDSALTLKASTKLKVAGDLTLQNGNVNLSGSAYVISGRVKTEGGNLTIGSGISVGGANVEGKLTVQSGGTLYGNFYAKEFILDGGTVGLGTGFNLDAEVGKYLHKAGTIQRYYVHVTKTGTNSVEITGENGTCTGQYVYIDTDGSATISGGNKVNYKDVNLYCNSGNTVVAGGFVGGITCKSGNITIGGADNDTTEYQVGYGISRDDPQSGYQPIYASGNIVWKGKAIGYFTSAPKYSSATEITAEGSVEIGSESKPIKGYFSSIVSNNSYVKAYVGSVMQVKAKGDAYVYVSGNPGKDDQNADVMIGIGNSMTDLDDCSAGITSVNGNIHVKWISGVNGSDTPAVMRGHYNCNNGKFYFDGEIDTAARIQCKDVYGLDYVVTHTQSARLNADGKTQSYEAVTEALYLSLYLTNPDGKTGSIKKDVDGFFVLNYSLGVKYANMSASKNVNGITTYRYPDTGALSIPGSLKFDSPIHVDGELWVDGIFRYNNSETNLVCVGGLYCLNDNVSLPDTSKGKVYLPNVKTISLNADIALNAPQVKNITLGHDINGSLSLGDCDSFTVASGFTISGSLKIKDSGVVTNNGTIGESVSCGEYHGTGTVGKDLIIKQNTTSEITGSGCVKGNIWTAGSIEIDSTATFGGKGSNSKGTYIYAVKDITIKNAKFYNENNRFYRVAYILSKEGNIYLKNCTGFVPKIYCLKGGIKLENDSTHKAEVESILSFGTYVWMGTSDSTSYITVTGYYPSNPSETNPTVSGDVEWHGSYSGGYAMDFWGNKSTTIKGSLLAFGTGNVHYSTAQIEGPAHFRNTGTVDSTNGAKISGMVSINSSTSNTPVTKATIRGTVEGNVVIYGNASKTEITIKATTGKDTDNYIHMHSGKSLTIDGEVKGGVNVSSVTTVNLNNKVGGSFTISSGTLTTKEADATIGKNIRAYNAELHINANVGGNVTHSAPNISSSNPMKLVALGNQKYQITVNGNITVHGRLVDNSKQLGSDRKIYCKGAYYGDLKKEFNADGSDTGCTQLNFTSEADGQCFLVGYCKGNWEIKNTVFNIDGIFSIYTFYNQTDAKYYTLTIDKEVKCKTLLINSSPYDAYKEVSDGADATQPKNMTSSPSRKVILYSTNENSNKAKGLDKRAYLVNFETVGVKWLDIYYSSDYWPDNKDLIYFKGKVSVTGNCYACNTKFGNQLNTEGQTSLYYCLLYSAGYSSDINHCSVRIKDDGTSASSDDLKYLKNDGAFLHTKNTNTGDNYFDHVNTYSNVMVYNGISHIFGGSVFKGCTYAGTDQEKSYNGHRSTKFFFFGDSLEIYGESKITSSAQNSVYLCAGRTIIWVKKGAMVVRDGSYIGAERAFMSNTGDTMKTRRHSMRPGIFVSDTGGGTVKINGTNYDKGGLYLIGKNSSTPSTITLDICAYKTIKVSGYGQIYEKNKKQWNSDEDVYFKYVAGLYVTSGSVVEETHGEFGFNYTHDDLRTEDGDYAKKKVYTGSSYNSSGYYLPNDAKYQSLLNKSYGTYEKYLVKGRNHLKTTYSQSLDSLKNYYTPRDSAPTVAAPNGINIDNTTKNNITTAQGTSVTDSVIVTEKSTSDITIPSMPTIDAAGTIFGDATVSPVVVKNSASGRTPKQRFKYDVNDYNSGHEEEEPPYHPIEDATLADQADLTVAFAGWRAQKDPQNWSNSYYDGNESLVKVKRPSLEWTSGITAHFDKTESRYWNERFIPYVWKLPYDYGENKTTKAKRILKGAELEWKNGNTNGDFGLLPWYQNEMKGNAYYVNADHYAGSGLAKWANKLKGWRTISNTESKLYDYVAFNGVDTEAYTIYNPFGDDLVIKDDSRRRSKLLIFESGELPYQAFYMSSNDDMLGDSDDFDTSGAAAWKVNGTSYRKTIGQSTQQGWWLGSEKVSYYDVGLIFYTCTDPANPYTSDPKDLHVVLPQGIATRFCYDSNNTVTVIGNGRVFLYLTSGDSIHFKARTAKKGDGPAWDIFDWTDRWDDPPEAVYANPVGGLRKVTKDGKTVYEPLLYIIGAGTNIDLILEDMPFAGCVYMPFGWSTSLYSASNGNLYRYNQFYSLTNLSKKFYDGYTLGSNKQTVAVGRNQLTLYWSDTTVGYARYLYGQFITDKFVYQSAGGKFNLNFKNADVKPNLGETVIYNYSTKTNSKNEGSEPLSLDNFLINAPTYSEKYLNWKYVGLKVEQ